MSTDYSLVCDTDKTYAHLGQRFTSGFCFGYGLNDTKTRETIGEYIIKRCRYNKPLKVVLTDDIPIGYRCVI